MPEPAMPGNDRLDLLIDSAIETYAEPPAGLEDRILGACAAMRFQSPAKPLAFPVRRLLPWFVALTAAACVLVAVMVRNHPSSRPLQAHILAAPHTQPATVAPVIPIHHQPRRPSRPRSEHILAATQPVPAPKLDVFPTPEPLTPRERAFAATIARAPRPKLDALITAQQQSNEPLTIRPIQIQPIEPPNLGSR